VILDIDPLAGIIAGMVAVARWRRDRHAPARRLVLLAAMLPDVPWRVEARAAGSGHREGSVGHATACFAAGHLDR
jgi:hypothetical protein